MQCLNLFFVFLIYSLFVEFVCSWRATKAIPCEDYFGCDLHQPIFQVCFDPKVYYFCLSITYVVKICGNFRFPFELDATIGVGSILAAVFKGSKGPLFQAGEADFSFHIL